MKSFILAILMQLIIIGMAINVRTDIPFWKQFIAYVLIACILPVATIIHKKQ